jgi:hydroxypyruvate isomerase
MAERLHVMAALGDPADEAARTTFAENLAWAAELASTHGIQLLIEPINRADIPGYFLSDFDAAARLVETSPASSLGLQFDIYHCQKIHGDVLDRLARFAPITAHLQIAGLPARHEPSPTQLPLGEIFALLDEQQYAGRVGCGYHPAAGTIEGLAWIHALERAGA